MGNRQYAKCKGKLIIGFRSLSIVRCLLTLPCCLLLITNCQLSIAQDIHFSQLNHSQLFMNPATAADMTGDMAASLRYRKQWPGIGKGYGTNAATFEMSLLRQKSNTNYLGVGVYIVSDKAGKAQLQTFEGVGSLAYHLRTGTTERFSMGLSLGYVQRSIRTDGLAWDAQHNGIAFDAALDNRETFGNQSRSIVDGTFGLLWWHSSKTEWKFGYSLGHFLQQRTFLDAGSDKLSAKHSAHFMLKYKIPFMYVVYIRYDLQVQRQAGAMTILPGVMAERRIGNDSRYTGANTSSGIMAGCNYRIGDAIVPTIGFEWERMLSLFISYDITLSSFNKAVGTGGGPEITLRYEGKKTRGVARLSEE